MGPAKFVSGKNMMKGDIHKPCSSNEKVWEPNKPHRDNTRHVSGKKYTTVYIKKLRGK